MFNKDTGMREQQDWQSVSEKKLSLADQDVHIWRASLIKPESTFEKLMCTLSNDERARANRFRFEKHRRRFVIARGALRDILRRYLDVDAGTILFEYARHGKPALSEKQNPGEIRFNLSHAEELAVCAITTGRAVGIDVEYIPRSLSDADKIAKRFFSKQESDAFLKLPEAQKREAFFNCWTRKEAFIKAIGEGLTHPLHQFEVAFLPGETPALLDTRPDPREAEKWMLSSFIPAENYIGAVVVEGKKLDFAYWQWEGKDD
jgi:4'-phosphopantetheinyl transferase